MYIVLTFDWIQPTYVLAPVGHAMYQMLVIQAFRPDNLQAALMRYIGHVMGENFTHHAEQELDMATIVDNEVRLIFN